MTKVWDLTKTIAKMFVLRAKPQELPQSAGLLAFACIIFLVTKTASLLWFIQIFDKIDPKDIIRITYYGAAVISFIWLLLLFAILRTTFSYYNMLGRFMQTVTAFVIMDCCLNIVYLLWLGVLSTLDVSLISSENVLSMAIIIGFVLIMYWQFMVYIYLLRYSMDISILKAGVFSLFYMLLQQNLSEILLNAVITVTEL